MFKKNGPNEPWNQAAFQLLSETNKDIHHGKLTNVTKEKTSRRKASRTSIHKDIRHIKEKITDVKKIVDFRRKEFLASIRNDLLHVKAKLADLTKIVADLKTIVHIGRKAGSTRKFNAEANVTLTEFDVLQQMLGMMETSNIGEHNDNETPKQVTNDMRQVKLADLKTGISRRAMVDVALCSTTPQGKATFRRKVSDFLDGSHAKATFQATMDLSTPQGEVTLGMGMAKPRSKATEVPDLFRRRERRLKAMREALIDVSAGKKSVCCYLEGAGRYMAQDDGARKQEIVCKEKRQNGK
jgi:hypothetical protein